MAVCGTPTIRTVRCIVTECLDFASALSVHADSVHAMVSRGDESHDKLVSNALLLLAPQDVPFTSRRQRRFCQYALGDGI